MGAVGMVAAFIVIPWYPGTSPARTLFKLFVLRPILHVAVAGTVLHVIQVPYKALNWSPVAWLGKISYSLYLWQELFLGKFPFPWGLLGAFLAAELSWRIIEKPALELRDRVLAPPRLAAT